MMPLWAKVSKRLEDGRYLTVTGLLVDFFLTLRQFLFSEVRANVLFALENIYKLLQFEGNQSLLFPLASYQMLARLQELFHIPIWGPHTMLTTLGKPIQVDIFALVKDAEDQAKVNQ